MATVLIIWITVSIHTGAHVRELIIPHTAGGLLSTVLWVAVTLFTAVASIPGKLRIQTGSVYFTCLLVT